MPRVDPSLAADALGDMNPTSGDWMRGPCPYCEASGHRDRKASFGINTVSGWFSCFRCSVKGRLDGDWEDRAPRIVEAATEVGPPEGYQLISSPEAWEASCYAEAREYLTYRGVGRKTAAATKIGVVLNGRYHHRVILPVLAPDGAWRGWVGRVWIKKPQEMPYSNMPGTWRSAAMFNEAACDVESTTPLIVVEGAFDAIACWPYGVAVLGKPSAWQIERLANAKRPVSVVLDGDAWMEGLALSRQLQLRGQRAGTVTLPATKDPDEIPLTELLEAARLSVEMGEVEII